MKQSSVFGGNTASGVSQVGKEQGVTVERPNRTCSKKTGVEVDVRQSFKKITKISDKTLKHRKELGKYIENLATDKGFNHKQLADVSGETVYNIRNLIKGENVSTQTIMLVLMALEVNMVDLLANGVKETIAVD